ncbi:MAG: glycoside hydrolase family 44 protein [Sphingobium sp.]|uniref:glycoside hydrolase family 44 protein n=1 Tax=Sphingobium sp. TaxID=1912891 RepID=UPI0029AD6D46|nr:glycoside hydrolase family 44 protein [Sphingobium sp.]MDX3909849.1 glycoside hydrolase family 44 protein [Sphingobium sp.]
MKSRHGVLLVAVGLLLPAGREPDDLVRIKVDLSAPGHPISPLIYGVSFASAEVLRDLYLPLNRAGGNSASLYNWRIDARNAGSDYFFESLPVRDPVRDQFGSGFVALTKRGGASAMLTFPLNGWVARLGPQRSPLAGFSVAKYGPQAVTDQWMPDAGNGFGKDRRPISGNDPDDAATPVSIADQQAWIRALVAEWGRASQGGVAYYLMDNEPSLWHLTHRHVRPVGAHTREIADKVIEAAATIKAVDPSAKIVAPEEWGWGGYKDSGFDQQLAAAKGALAQSDRVRQTGGIDYLPWLLQRWKAAGSPVDVVSVHFYPQGGEYATGGNAGPQAIQLLRNRSTRLLWDKQYREESWIAQPVALVSLLRGWVDRYYRPGTPIAITEYNWGGEDSMSGATAQADIWGIFGRERLDMANRWPAPKVGTPTYQAMKLIRNYDGNGAGFGDMSLPVTVPDSDRVSAFAARRSGDGALTVLVINKQADRDARLSIALAGRTPADARLRTIRLANRKVETLPVERLNRNMMWTIAPPQSVTMLVLETQP